MTSVNWTVAEYLTYWLRQVVREDRRPKTYQGYEGVVRLHLIPGLGKKRLSKLTAQDVRTFITRTRQECQCCKHGWDAQRGQPRCCAAWRPVLRVETVRADGPVDPRRAQERAGVRGPRGNNPAQRRQAGPGTGTPVQDQPRPDRAPGQGNDLRPPTGTGCPRCTSWRSSSACDAGSCSASAGRMSTWTRRSWKSSRRSSGSAGRCALSRPRPRTPRGRSRFPRSAWKRCASTQRQFAERSEAWPDWEDHGLVFPSRRGTPMEPDNLRRSWGEIRQAGGPRRDTVS